jgi:hypothetical protein
MKLFPQASKSSARVNPSIHSWPKRRAVTSPSMSTEAPAELIIERRPSTSAQIEWSVSSHTSRVLSCCKELTSYSIYLTVFFS